MLEEDLHHAGHEPQLWLLILRGSSLNLLHVFIYPLLKVHKYTVLICG